MIDQAHDLRQLAHQTRHSPSGRPRVVAVAGGKGGVGTTTLAVNLAVALAARRQRTVLIDADPDGAGVADLCRLQERWTWADVLASRAALAAALQPGPGGIRVLGGTWGLGRFAEIRGGHDRFIEQLPTLWGSTDIVVLDTGNGSSRLTAGLWCAADLVLLVTTPAAASVMNAYAAVRTLASSDRPEAIRLIVNLAADRSQAEEVHDRLARTCLRFLGRRLALAGHLPPDPRVASAGENGEAFVLALPHCPAARETGRLADTIKPRMAFAPQNQQYTAQAAAAECR